MGDVGGGDLGPAVLELDAEAVAAQVDVELAAGDGLHRLDRPRLDQHDDRGGAGHHQPDPGAAPPQRLLRQPGAPSPVLQQFEDRAARTSASTTRSSRLPLLGPHHPPGGAAGVAAGRDAGAHRPGRDRRGDLRAARRTCRPRPTTGPRNCSTERVWHIPRPSPSLGLSRAVRSTRGRARADPDRGRRRASTPRRPKRCPFAEPPASRSPRPRRARARCPGTTRSTWAASARPAAGANALARDADLVIGVGTRYSDFTNASRTAFQNPGVRFVNVNVAEFDADKHAAPRWSPTRGRPSRH